MNRSFDDHLGVVCLFVAISLSIVTSLAFGIGSVSASTIAQPRPAATPAYTGYKGVKIGMSDEDARKLLGTPKEKGDGQDYYVYSDNESAQVLYGADKTVRVISINYIGQNAPSPMDILGTAVESKPDGSMNKMVRYPKSGFWISYLKTGGDDPMVIVTVQKMAVEP